MAELRDNQEHGKYFGNMKIYSQRKAVDGSIEMILTDTTLKTVEVLETIQTKESKIKSTNLFTEEQKTFLIDLFK